MLRKIIGIISQLNTPYVNAIGTIELLDNSFTYTSPYTSYVVSSLKYATDNQGRIFNPLTPNELGITIWCNAESSNSSRYRFTYPDRRFFDFSLVPGNSDIDISTLRYQGIIDQPEPSILDVVNQSLTEQWQETLSLLGTEYATATTNLSALRIANLATGNYASASDISHLNSPKGFITISVISGQQFPLIFAGTRQDLSWNWNLNSPIFLGVNGSLTQSMNNLVFLQTVAQPITANKILLSFEEPLIL